MEKIVVRGAIAEFDDEHTITDIVLLGKDGAVRRIQFEVEEDET